MKKITREMIKQAMLKYTGKVTKITKKEVKERGVLHRFATGADLRDPFPHGGSSAY